MAIKKILFVYTCLTETCNSVKVITASKSLINCREAKSEKEKVLKTAQFITQKKTTIQQ